MKKLIAITFGVAAHSAFLASFLYAIGFVGNFLVPKTIDSGITGPFWESMLINLGLILMFGLQHSIMARQGFKQWLGNFIPKHLERSVYILFTGLCLGLLFWLWQPMTEVIWHFTNGWMQGLFWGLFGLGWILVLVSAELISGAHLIGRRQIQDYLNDREPSAPDFQVPGLYKLTRHPMMVGFLLAFWATPQMTAGHLLFTGATTLYIFIALPIEERDMVRFFGDRYRIYKERVPMLIPIPKGRPNSKTD